MCETHGVHRFLPDLHIDLPSVDNPIDGNK